MTDYSDRLDRLRALQAYTWGPADPPSRVEQWISSLFPPQLPSFSTGSGGAVWRRLVLEHKG